eukprot:8654088-Pyramimonas_sp.AAC.1
MEQNIQVANRSGCRPPAAASGAERIGRGRGGRVRKTPSRTDHRRALAVRWEPRRVSPLVRGEIGGAHETGRRVQPGLAQSWEDITGQRNYITRGTYTVNYLLFST